MAGRLYLSLAAYSYSRSTSVLPSLTEQQSLRLSPVYIYNAMCMYISAANVSTDMLPSLFKEDLHDLFPGPEHFLQRGAIWRATHGEMRY